MKKVLVYFFITVFNSILIQAQVSDPGVLGKVTIASPNAAAFAKYVDVPVNNHTGIPEITIPIYKVTEGPLSLTIDLSYHAGGTKLDELSSWVGFGWSLNAGGAVTRQVRGTPDECGVAEYGKNTKGFLGHNGYNNFLFKQDANNQSPLSTGDVSWWDDLASGIADGEPDLFFFNFNGHAGKFYFNDDGRPMLLPEADYKIEYNYTHATGSGSPQSISQFIITTIDGTKYFFGKTDAINDVDPIEKTQTYYTYNGAFQTPTSNTISSWFLYRVESADGLFSINLIYVSEQYSYRSISGVTKRSDDYVNITSGNWNEYGHWVQGVRLSAITTNSNNVNLSFIPGSAREDLNDWTSAQTLNDVVNSDAKRLNSIQISNSSGLCKKFNFIQSYFISDATGFPGQSAFTDQKRLKLEQMQEMSCDEQVSVPPHVFEYYAESIPRRLSFAKDHWGFVNGKTQNLNLIPSYIEKSEPSGAIIDVDGADRDPSWPAMRAGAIKKINYPTGGFTEFEFEPNTTFVNFTKYTKEPRLTISMGYDCNSSAVYQNFTFTSNPYSVKLTNTGIGGTSYFNTASSVLYTEADANETVQSAAMVGPGTQQIWISKPGIYNCSGTHATLYEWVPNTITENKIVGGLRIKKISHNEGIGTSDLIKEYSYNETTGNSSGHLYSRPTYVQFIRNNYLKDAGVYTINTSSSYYHSAEGYENIPTSGPASGTFIVSPVSTRPMETTQGNHIGYNEVKVFSSGNGYSIFRYYGSNIWDNNYDDIAVRKVIRGYPSNPYPNYPEAPVATDFKRGNLKYDGHFTESNQLLKETDYYYTYAENSIKTPAIIMGFGVSAMGWPTYIGVPGASAGIFPTFYELSTSKLTQRTTTERVFQSTTSTLQSTKVEFFESLYHNQITKLQTTGSKGESIELTYKYAPDFQSSNCISISDGRPAYESSCSSCQTQYIANRNLSGHNSAYWKFWDYQAFLKCKSLARIAFSTTRKDYYNSSVSGGYAYCMQNFKASANADLKPILELSDRFILSPLEVVSKLNGNLTSASFTKYEFSSSLPGMVYPVKSQRINVSEPTSTFTPAAVNGTGLTKDLRYEDEASIKTEIGNIVEVVGRDGVVTSYIWGFNNTVPIVKATGASYATLSSAYNAVSGNISQLRTYPTLLSSFIATYDYLPGIGMVSESDARGRNIFYEYDKLTRLVLVRDHDNRVIKKICYNYQGQSVNCSSPCTITGADWQNTTTALRCQTSSGNNTGYQEQEQKDMNSCSPTYNQTRWVVAGQNLDLCPLPPANVSLTSTNNANVSGFIATYTNVSTNEVYSFGISSASGTQGLGAIPPGTYNLYIHANGNSILYDFGSGCNGQTLSGSYAVFYNISVSSSTCNSITLDYGF